MDEGSRKRKWYRRSTRDAGYLRKNESDQSNPDSSPERTFDKRNRNDSDTSTNGSQVESVANHSIEAADSPANGSIEAEPNISSAASEDHDGSLVESLANQSIEGNLNIPNADSPANGSIEAEPNISSAASEDHDGSLVESLANQSIEGNLNIPNADSPANGSIEAEPNISSAASEDHDGSHVESLANQSIEGDLNISNAAASDEEYPESEAYPESDEYPESEDYNSDFDDEDPDPDQDDTPVYNGAPITLRESALATLTFILTFKLSGLCVIALLGLVSLHCGPENILLKTLYKFKKYFQMIGKKFVKIHYYCSNCEVLLPDKNSVCCPNQKFDSYFIEFPIKDQLVDLFARAGFYENLQYRFNRVKKNVNNVEDIYDGAIYQQFFQGGFLSNPNNISFFMYFDGIAIFRSTNFSIWPTYLTINELRYKLRTRKENTVLAGLWFGTKKPNANLFLRPVHNFLTSFEENGVNVSLPNGNIINVKGKLLGAVGDMPAKALFMRFIQYNGAFSCFNCVAQGGRYDVGRNASIQVFPYSRNLELRNNDETREFATQAVAARRLDPDANVYGVKGPSLLSHLLPDMINCMGIDIMHGVFIGLMKTVTGLWFDGQHSDAPFSISNLVHLVDRRLKRIKPPSSFQNVTRSIKKDLGLWKAFDYKAFFFYYSLVVLRGILPDRYWIHHLKVVTAISLLNQDSVAPEDFDSAEDILDSYVADFQQLYGIRFMTLTVHQLLHLVSVCRNLGPAWVFSCFFYEGLNGELVRLIHGTRYAALQICSSSSVFMKLPTLINSMAPGEAKAFCLKLQSKSADSINVTEWIDFQTGVVGQLKTCFPVPPYISALLRIKFNITGGRYKYFYRLKRKGLVYTSETYLHSTLKVSFYVQAFFNNIPHLCKVIHFIRWSACQYDCTLDCGNCPKRYFCVVTVYERIMWEVHDAPLQNVLPHLNKVSPRCGYEVFPVEAIRSMCIYMPVEDDEYISEPINNLEVE